MNAKRMITVVLLVFVAGSLAWFGVKEIRHAKAVKSAKGLRAASTAAKAVQTPTAEPREPTPAIPTTATPLEPTPVPVPKRDPSTKAVSRVPTVRDGGSKIIVYYLHTTARCPSCLKIEAYTAAEVTGALAGPLSDGRLQWKVVNVDEPKNAHFTDDYQLYTKSVVVSEMRDGKEVRWKRLDKVWDLLGDQQAFMKYVDDEVRAYLKDLS
jgi:hypothetical protein